MSFAAPLSITYNAVAVALPSVGTGINSAQYRDPSGAFTVDVGHYYNKSNRAIHTTKLTRKVLTTNPVIPAQNMNIVEKSTFTVDVPSNVTTVAEAVLLVKAQLAWLSANTYLIATQLVGGES